MDSFFGIGLPELLVILLLAGLVMGPKRIQQVARTLGRVTAQLQSVSREFARQLNAELDALDGDEIKGTVRDMRELQREVEALRKELSQVPKSLSKESTEAVQDAKKAFERSQNDHPAEAEATAELEEESSPLPKLIEVPDDSE